MKAIAILLALLAAAPVHAAGPILLDDFEDLARWTAHPADGVSATISSDSGESGNALRVDFDFRGRGGYAVIRGEIAFDLTENYVITFRIRAEAPENHLEFKMIDGTGENVWWSVKRNFHYPEEWTTVRIKKRQVSFAWGPLGGGELARAEAIEFAITAGTGGSGTVWIDELELTPLPPPNPDPPNPVARVSSAAAGHAASLALDGDSTTFWESARNDDEAWIALDLGGSREFGGLVIDWEPGRHAPDYEVEISYDRGEWRPVREVRGSNGGRDYVYAPETESSWIRIRSTRAMPDGIALREIAIKPLEWSETRNAFFEAIAKDAPRGTYPRGMSGEAVYWTVVGAPGDPVNALFSEDGAVEPWPGEFTIEPFLYVDGEMLGWNEVRWGKRLDQYGRFPVPTVETWPLVVPNLAVTAFAIGDPGSSSLVVRYRLHHGHARRVSGELHLAVRPFQVNPPYQILNIRGGMALIRSIHFDGNEALVNGNRRILVFPSPESKGATVFDGGEIVEDFLRSGRLPEGESVVDPFEAASGALAFPFDLEEGEIEEVILLIPLHGDSPVPDTTNPEERREWAEGELEETRTFWDETLNRKEIHVPGFLRDEVHAQLAYILVNRSGPAIRPGTRAYARSWIRDGALTCTALLRLGHPEPVKEYIEWFAEYQYENGKIPCCVDDRGADPVPEHDSSGEFIYLIAEYCRYTKDLDLARAMWPRVDAAAEYLDGLRQERRTDEYRTPEKERFFGLLPPSISHEGYSAKPMHSYWDDFFALRGFKDAVYLAELLGLDREEAHWTAVRDEFARELRTSIEKTMEFHGIDFIPGCADLGDFDPTSTTIVLDPVEAGDVVPREALERTFERYWEFFVDRRETEKWEAFTPYEMRNIGAFARLGWRERAEELLNWFLEYRRPRGWNQWAEVVWKEERAPRFIGDMPHTWVGSDFIRSVLDLYPDLLAPKDSTSAR